MNKCVICNKEIKTDSQFIKDRWYHNKCIESLQENYERIYNENCILKEKHNITDISLLDENYNLKKIIIELEKHLKSKYYEWKNSDNEIIKESAYEDLRILDYLKELKGDKK